MKKLKTWFILGAIHLAVFGLYIAFSMFITGPATATDISVKGIKNFIGESVDGHIKLEWTVTPLSQEVSWLSDKYTLLRKDLTQNSVLSGIKTYTCTNTDQYKQTYIDTDVEVGHKYKYMITSGNEIKVQIAQIEVLPSGYTPSTQIEDKGSPFEKLIAGPLEGLYIALQAAGFQSYEELIFGTEAEPEKAPFTSQEWDKLSDWYLSLTAATFGLVFIGIILTAYKLMGAALNPLAKINAMDELWRWVMVIGILLAAPIFIQMMFLLNTGLTNVIYAVSTGLGVAPSLNNEFFNNISTGNVLLTAIIKVAYMFLLVYLNFLFAMRKFVLATLFVFTCIMAYIWAINNKSPAAGIWIGEVISNAFMGASYALVFCIWNSLLSNNEGVMATWWFKLFGMVILIPTAEMLRNSMQGITRFFGVNEQKSAALASAGFGGMMGLMNFGKSMAGMRTPVNTGLAGGGNTSTGFIPSSQVAGSSDTGTGSSISFGSQRYSNTPSGLLVPQSVNTSTGAQAETPDAQGSFNPSALHRAQTVGHLAGRVGGAAGRILGTAAMSPVAAVAPGAVRGVSDMAGRVGGKISGFAGAGGYLAGSMISRSVKGESPGEAIQNITGQNDMKTGVASLVGTMAGSTYSPNRYSAPHNNFYQGKNYPGDDVTTHTIDHFRYS